MSSSTRIASASVRDQAWWRRLHAALMPDYNRKATVYWWLVAAIGAGLLGWAIADVAQRPPAVIVQVAVGCAIAMLAGLFPVRVPGSKNSFAAGEIFIFLLLLMHGPAAAVLAAAGEGLVGSMRTSKRATSRIISPAIAALTMALTGSALHLALAVLARHGVGGAPVLLLATMFFALGYFFCSTLLITAVPYLKRSEWPTAADLFGNFGWVGVTYATSALVAGLLHLTFEELGIGVVAAAAPIIAMLLTMLHYHFRRREADEAAQQVRVEAAEREAAQAARHVEELRSSEQRFHSAFSNAAIGMALVSTDGRMLQVNRAMALLLARDEAELVGGSFGALVGDASVMERLTPLSEDGAERPDVEVQFERPGGGMAWASMHAGYFSEPHSRAPCLILQVQDISARREAELRLQHIAYHDGLTSLCNRSRFREHLAQAIAAYRGDRRRPFAVMYLDFDRFKLINDTLGHSAGDEFLTAVARRIQQQVRPADIVGRLGGDEFAILAQQIDDGLQALAMAERLQLALREPYQVAGTEINSSASIGIAFASEDHLSPDDVLRDADIAMYRAKAEGRARCALFDAALRAEVDDQVQLEHELRAAIERDEITLEYQPLFDLAGGQMVGFEALARWRHAERGTIGPDRFIPIAEETGLIGVLTERILGCACRQLKLWQGQFPQRAPLTMHVNLSGISLCQDLLALQVAKVLLETGLAPSQLTLEITETMLMSKLENALGTMNRLREIGAGLSVDDFGTGYSSLSYLSTLPITSLKIDRSFVDRLGTAQQDAEVVKAIIMLGNALGKMVFAEGVETPEQLAELRKLGCRYGQGYLLSRPMPAAAIATLLARPPSDNPVAMGPARVAPSPSVALH